MFKILILCAFVFMGYTATSPRTFVKFSPELVALIKTAVNQCITPQNTAAEVFKIIKEGEFKEDDDFKKMIHCAYQLSGFSNEDGTINVKMATSIYPDPSVISNVIEECSKNVGTPVENSYHFFKCYQTTSPLLVDLDL